MWHSLAQPSHVLFYLFICSSYFYSAHYTWVTLGSLQIKPDDRIKRHCNDKVKNRINTKWKMEGLKKTKKAFLRQERKHRFCVPCLQNGTWSLASSVEIKGSVTGQKDTNNIHTVLNLMPCKNLPEFCLHNLDREQSNNLISTVVPYPFPQKSASSYTQESMDHLANYGDHKYTYIESILLNA